MEINNNIYYKLINLVLHEIFTNNDLQYQMKTISCSEEEGKTLCFPQLKLLYFVAFD